MGQVIEAANRFRPFVRPHAPREGGEEYSRWICIDDRYALVDGLYRQTAGGPIGVGHDTAVAIGMGGLRRRGAQGSREVTEAAQRRGLSTFPIQVIGGIAAKALKNEGVQMLLHEGCAAELFAPGIVNIIAENTEYLYEQAMAIKPDLSEEQFELALAVNQQLDSSQRVLNPKIAAPLLERGGLWVPEEGTAQLWTEPGQEADIISIDRVGLVSAPHVSPDMIANYGRGVAYDAREAWKKGAAAYHISMGDMTEIMDPLRDLMPFGEDDYLAATAVRHAATSLALPKPDGYNRPLINIHRLDIAA